MRFLLILLFVVHAFAAAAEDVRIRLGTLAPRGTTWHRTLLEMGEKWRAGQGPGATFVVFTDGYDSRSTIDNPAVLAIAARADVVLHAVLADSPVVVFPRYRASRETLVDAARRTGGDAHTLGGAVSDFRAIVNDFRSSYVLRYTPKGVTREGWHDLAVRVTRPGQYSVRARQGYDGG